MLRQGVLFNSVLNHLEGEGKLKHADFPPSQADSPTIAAGVMAKAGRGASCAAAAAAMYVLPGYTPSGS